MLIFKNSLTVRKSRRTLIIGNFSNKVNKIQKNLFRVTMTRTTMKTSRMTLIRTPILMILMKQRGLVVNLGRLVERGKERIKIQKNKQNLKSSWKKMRKKKQKKQLNYK